MNESTKTYINPKRILKAPAHFDDFVQALIGYHPHVGFAVITAEQEHLHGDAEQFLKFWGCSAFGAIKKISQETA